ncbi:MAG: hypothetical protein OXI16_09440 [Chloroflexota bacterium]|nr:hypothetical protein [Chloroflexota bacterium]
MNELLGHIAPWRRTGDERLHAEGKPVHDDATLLNFGQWYGSDILNNTESGALAEYIVAQAIGDKRVTEGVRETWDFYDVVTSDDAKVEVKSSAYIQTWGQKEEYTPRFDIARKSWDPTPSNAVRLSDVYIFCLHNRRVTDALYALDPIDVSQWDFYILQTSTLEREVPNQNSIGIARLNRLGARKVPFDQIRSTICEMISQSDSTTVT